jgi:parallel beta-helix repeat protein
MFNGRISRREMLKILICGSAGIMSSGLGFFKFGNNSSALSQSSSRIDSICSKVGYGNAKLIVIGDGSTYHAISDDGSIIQSGTDPTSVIHQGINKGLTLGRTYKETVKLKGNFLNLTTLLIPSYVTLDLSEAYLKQANGTNNHFLTNEAITYGSNTEIDILGGIIDGNKATQTPHASYQNRNMIQFTRVTHGMVRDAYLINSNGSAVNLSDCTNFVGVRNTVISPLKLAFYTTDGQYVQWVGNYVRDPGENFAATYSCDDVLIADNFGQSDGAQWSTGINITRSLRNVVRNNWVINAGITGIVFATELNGISTDTQIIGNAVINPNSAGIAGNSAYASDNVVIKDNKVFGKTNPARDDHGIRLSSGLRCRIEGNQVTNFKFSGIKIEGSNTSVLGKDFTNDRCLISSNQCWNNGRASVDTPIKRSGISLQGLSQDYLKNTLVQNNICYDTAGTNGTQLYGIHYQGTLNVIISQNDFRGNVKGDISTAGINNGPPIVDHNPT